MPYLTSQIYEKRYFGSVLSSAQIGCVIMYVIIVLLPFFLAFATNGFWLQMDSYRDSPNVDFRNEVIIMNYEATSSRGYSSIPDLQSAFTNQILSPSVKAVGTDLNNDGKYDYFDFEISFIEATQNLRMTQIFLFFDYELDTSVRLQMIDFIRVEFSSGGGIAGGRAIGTLNFRQLNPLSVSSVVRSNYNQTILQNYTLSTDLLPLIQEKARRNETLRFDYTGLTYPSSAPGRATFNIRVNIPPEQTILIYPRLIENIKFAWFQYLSLLLPIAIVLRTLLRFIYRNRFLRSRMVSDLKPVYD